jgi:hypothetical protein
MLSAMYQKSDFVEAPTPPAGPRLLDGFLTPQELAGELGRRLETINRWRRLGRGPPVTMIGRFPYYARAKVIEWLNQQPAA